MPAPRRTLALKKEVLSELSADELRAVAGAAPWTPSCPLIMEITEVVSQLESCRTC